MRAAAKAQLAASEIGADGFQRDGTGVDPTAEQPLCCI